MIGHIHNKQFKRTKRVKHAGSWIGFLFKTLNSQSEVRSIAMICYNKLALDIILNVYIQQLYIDAIAQ